MELEYFGQSFWKVSTGGVSIVLDPFSNIGYPMPANLSADYVFISHEHHDHNNAALIKGHPKVIRTAGNYNFPEFSAELISVFHDDVKGAKRGTNQITKLTLEDMTLVHCGDLGHMPDQEVLERIDHPDLLLVPVGEYYTLDLPAVWKLISVIRPQLILPMHYKTALVSFPLSSLEAFLVGQDKVTRLGSNILKVTKTQPARPGIIVFDWSAEGA